jgi:hypothetical protein
MTKKSLRWKTDTQTAFKETHMKIKDLIAALSSLPPDADVFVWDAGNRLGLVDVDTSFLDEHFIDLNTDTDTKGETA